jgi:hypothetical protein
MLFDLLFSDYAYHQMNFRDVIQLLLVVFVFRCSCRARGSALRRSVEVHTYIN